MLSLFALLSSYLLSKEKNYYIDFYSEKDHNSDIPPHLTHK